MTTRSFIAPALASLAALTACSSSTVNPGSDGGGGGGGDLVATSRVTINSQMGAGVESGVNDAAKCQLITQPWIVIGDNTHPVSDGETQSGANVAVQCRVAVEGSGYAVSAKASLGGVGSVEISGHFDPNAQAEVHAVFTRGDTGTFTADDCTLSYTLRNMGVAAGRVWAVLDCPHATFAAQSRTCLGTSEFRFENCAQQ